MKLTYRIIPLAAVFASIVTVVNAQEIIHLLPGSDLPALTVYRPLNDRSKGTAAIICPGGAYAFRTEEDEGSKPAKRLNEAGITAFVLDYRLPKGNDTLPLHDAFTAIRYIREHHAAWKIDQNKLGILGFSAGGHLAATAATHFKSALERPDFLVLAYPVISMTDELTHLWSRDDLLGKNPDTAKIRLYSDELQVTGDTPGTFISHAMDDRSVKVENSLYFVAALQQHHVPVELFLYAHGGHAYDIYNRTAKVQWIDACIDWLKTEGWKRKGGVPGW